MSKHKKEDETIFGDIAEKLFLEGLPFKDAMDITRKDIEDFYAQAYHLYNTGKYEDACSMFRNLTIADPSDSRFTLGLAASHHLLKRYKEAIHGYLATTVIDPENPIPLYHMADCALQTDDKSSALIFLEMAIKRCGDKKEYAEIKERAHLTVDSIKKDINKKSK